MDGHDLLQLISSPTYNVCSAKPVLLDLYFIARPIASSVKTAFTLPPVADHCVVVVNLFIKKSYALKPYIKECWDYKIADVATLQEHLTSCIWTDNMVLNLDSAVKCWQS